MSYLELLKLISSPWCSTKEIQLIARCGRDTAIKIRKSIEKDIQKNSKLLPHAKTKWVPTQKVLEYIGLEVSYIQEMAKCEEQMNMNSRTSCYAGLSR